MRISFIIQIADYRTLKNSFLHYGVVVLATLDVFLVHSKELK